MGKGKAQCIKSTSEFNKMSLNAGCNMPWP